MVNELIELVILDVQETFVEIVDFQMLMQGALVHSKGFRKCL